MTQDLQSHRWQDRLLVLLTDDPANACYEQQLQTLQAAAEGVEERRLVLYHATPTHYRRGLAGGIPWQPGGELYERYRQADVPCEILLIGLDGGIKLRQDKLLTVEQLFNRIVQMRMRRAELRRQKVGEGS